MVHFDVINYVKLNGTFQWNETNCTVNVGS